MIEIDPLASTLNVSYFDDESNLIYFKLLDVTKVNLGIRNSILFD
jgi:hypothetical protein